MDGDGKNAAECIRDLDTELLANGTLALQLADACMNHGVALAAVLAARGVHLADRNLDSVLGLTINHAGGVAGAPPPPRTRTHGSPRAHSHRPVRPFYRLYTRPHLHVRVAVCGSRVS